eukprot:symbB.v1.2.006815.t1/scaffold409.1/size210228/18
MVHAGRPPTVGVKFGVNCFFNIDTKRIVMSPTMNLAASECHRVEVGALQEQLVEVEGTPSVRRRTFTLNTEAQIRAVPNFLTSEEVESVRSLLDPKSREDANPDFEGATAILKLFPFEEPSVKAIEARLISWNEFAPENLGPEARLLKNKYTDRAAEVSSWQYANGTGQPWLRSKVCQHLPF